MNGVSRHAPGRCHRARAEANSGFTLIEVLVVVAVTGTLLALALPVVGTGMVDARANGAMRVTAGFLAAARDSAVAQRRTVEIEFTAPNQMTATLIDGVNRRPLASHQLESGMGFRLEAGVPDTPDAFGATSAVDLGGGTRAWFLADGSLADDDGVPVSGTVFLGLVDKPLSARAVTVLGATGRVQAYRWDSRGWR